MTGKITRNIYVLFFAVATLTACTKKTALPNFGDCFDHCVDGGVMDLQKVHDDCREKCTRLITKKKHLFE